MSTADWIKLAAGLAPAVIDLATGIASQFRAGGNLDELIADAARAVRESRAALLTEWAAAEQRLKDADAAIERLPK